MGEVQILRVLPGEVGLARVQGTEVLLDIGTHVFNGGNTDIVGKVSYKAQHYFSHGRFHYLRVDRGLFAKAWVVVKVDGTKTVMPRVRMMMWRYIPDNMDHKLSLLYAFLCPQTASRTRSSLC